MPYNPTTWVNGVTAVNSTNMNKIEQGIVDAEALAKTTADKAVAPALLYAYKNIGGSL